MPLKPTKAVPVDTFLKATLYGKQGSGKTYTAMLFAEGLAQFRGGRVLLIDTEHGEKFLSRHRSNDKVHPEPFDYDVIHTRSLLDVVDYLETKPVYSVIILDSVTHLWEAAREMWEKKNGDGKDIPLRAWSSIKKPYKRMMKLLLDVQSDVFILGREKSIFESVNGELKKTGDGMKAEGETQYEPDFNFRMSLQGERGGVTFPKMLVEKDRSSMLAGRTFPKPTYETIKCLEPFLGNTVLESEDDDKRAERDVELLDRAEAERLAKSQPLFDGFLKELIDAPDIAAISEISERIKKKTRTLTSGHKEQLTEERNRRVAAHQPV